AEEAVAAYRLFRISGHEQHRQTGAGNQSGIGQIPSGKARQTDIGQQEVDREVVLQYRQRCSSVARFAAAIPCLSKQLGNHHAYRRHVIDDQHVLAIARWRVACNGRRLAYLNGSWQYQRHLGALSNGAADARFAPRLFGETVDGGQSKPGALAERLGREEWIENPVDKCCIDPDAIVPDGQSDVTSFSQPRAAARVLDGGSNGDIAAFWQSISGIDTQIEDSAFQLTGSDLGDSALLAQIQRQRNMFANGASQQFFQGLNL